MKSSQRFKQPIFALILFLVVFANSWAFSSSRDNQWTQNCPANLKGKYKGIYFYDQKSPKNTPTEFTLIIDSVGGRHFQGHTIESKTNWGPTHLKQFEAGVNGNCNGTAIRFIKTYKFNKGHSIDYEGHFEANELQGSWNIGPNWTGVWNATKQIEK